MAETIILNDSMRVAVVIVDAAITQIRPYTAEEIAAADARATAAANGDVLRTQVGAQVATMLASITAVQAVVDKANADIGPADIKALARELRKVLRQLLRLTRLVAGILDSTDSGVA